MQRPAEDDCFIIRPLAFFRISSNMVILYLARSTLMSGLLVTKEPCVENKVDVIYNVISK